MNRDDIIRMAREAGFERLGHDDDDLVCYPEELEVFATLVAAAKREWVGLTDEEIKPLCDENYIIYGAYTVDFIQSIEAKLKEKNHG